MIPRRTLLAAGPLALAACGKAEEAYFGKTDPPRTQRLVYHIAAEPETLDPAKTPGGSEEHILPSLFEGLVVLHPVTSEPLAALATHYESNADHTRFSFYLRGHPNPKGTMLSGAGVASRAARWSDGSVITAHDFVYSWRRVLDPKIAAPLAGMLYYIRNAQEVNAGKAPLGDLAVEALDDFTLQVEMRAPTPFFLLLHDIMPFYVVPRQAIEAAARRGNESSWTQPEHIVTGGPFTLAEWKPNESIRLQRCPHYYDAASVRLEQVTLLPVAGSAANMNLYKVGDCDWMGGRQVAPVYLPSLRRKKDFHTSPGFWCMFYAINTRMAPFDNVLVRYALNMATDKKAIARFLGVGQTPALSLMPPLAGYAPIDSLHVRIGRDTCDVLAYDPAAARKLLQQATVRSLRVEIHYPNHPATRNLPEILQQQWQQALGVSVFLTAQEDRVWMDDRTALKYKGVSESGWIGDYLDPNSFLETFQSGPNISGAGWADSRYDGMLAQANAAAGPAQRMKELAGCERHLLRAMPIVPLYHNVLSYLQKPYVKGFEPRGLGLVRFKYAWIDTNWRPQ